MILVYYIHGCWGCCPKKPWSIQCHYPECPEEGILLFPCYIVDHWCFSFSYYFLIVPKANSLVLGEKSTIIYINRGNIKLSHVEQVFNWTTFKYDQLYLLQRFQFGVATISKVVGFVKKFLLFSSVQSKIVQCGLKVFPKFQKCIWHTIICSLFQQ